MAQHLTLADVIGLHAEVMRRFGQPANPLRDEGALESAVMRTRMASHYEDADIIRQAALMAVGVSQAQAFLDGNKRTALSATIVFLELNGLRFTDESVAFARELERIAERPGERDAATDDFGAWLRTRVEPLGS
jgi:death-on-curing protein